MGTHGSLSKAGKMRHVLKQTPQFREERKGTDIQKYYHRKKHLSPRVKRRKQWEKLSRGEKIWSKRRFSLR